MSNELMTIKLDKSKKEKLMKESIALLLYYSDIHYDKYHGKELINNFTFMVENQSITIYYNDSEVIIPIESININSNPLSIYRIKNIVTFYLTRTDYDSEEYKFKDKRYKNIIKLLYYIKNN